MIRRPPSPPPFPYTTLFRSSRESRFHKPRPRRGCPEPSRPSALILGYRKSPAAASGLEKRLTEPASPKPPEPVTPKRSEEHTSELQSPCNLVCRLLLEKKNI